MSNLALIFLIASIVFVGLFIWLSINNYKIKYKMTYHLRNCFPYELNFSGRFKDNGWGNVALILSVIFSILFYVFFDVDHSNGYYIFIMIGGIIAILVVGALMFVPLKLLRLHLLLAVVEMVFAFLVPLGVCLASIKFYNSSKEVMDIVLCIFGGIICLITFVLVLNPKLSRWANLDKETKEDGTIEYKRPKFFVLAYTEWILAMLTFITQILVLILTNFTTV